MNRHASLVASFQKEPFFRLFSLMHHDIPLFNSPLLVLSTSLMVANFCGQLYILVQCIFVIQEMKENLVSNACQS